MGGFSPSAGQAGEYPPTDPLDGAVWGAVPTALCTVQGVGRSEPGALATGMPMSHAGHEILYLTTRVFTIGRDQIWVSIGIIVESPPDLDASPANRDYGRRIEHDDGMMTPPVVTHCSGAWGLVGSFDVLPILGSHAGGSDVVVARTNVGNPSIGADMPAFGGVVNGLIAVMKRI